MSIASYWAIFVASDVVTAKFVFCAFKAVRLAVATPAVLANSAAVPLTPPLTVISPPVFPSNVSNCVTVISSFTVTEIMSLLSVVKLFWAA